MNILIAGFQHETNTFAPTKATYQSFVQGEGFPPMARGTDVLELSDVNVPIGGFIQWAHDAGHDLIPVIWAGASASAHVTEEAYERISGEILDRIKQGGFDAIYLDLHGAMVTEHLDDGEGELLARIRDIVGNEMPLVVSLDLHANVTERMFQLSDALVAYRTYPHVDMADTGRRAGELLAMRIHYGRPLVKSIRRVPFLIPVNGMCTLVEPARGTYSKLEELEDKTGMSLSFAPGFPAADFDECGATFWGYGTNQIEVEQVVGSLHTDIINEEGRWHVLFLSPDEAAAEAIRLSGDADKPVIIADTQDNPGVGGDSNTMGMVKALLKHEAQGVAVGVIWDAKAAAKAHEAGVGAIIKLALGGGSGVAGDSPLQGEFEVIHLSDGHFRFDGPMLNGMKGELGPVACLRIGGLHIAVSSVKMQIFDRNLYRVAGIEPENMKILVNKSSVHFRADFEPIAQAILVVKAPGPMAADPADLPWKHLHPTMRTRPLGRSRNDLQEAAAGRPAR
jgi:microcystin degradation protein MlrC